MAAWLLVGVVVQGLAVHVKPLGVFFKMNDCFDARESVLSQVEKPKINYELVCVHIDRSGA